MYFNVKIRELNQQKINGNKNIIYKPIKRLMRHGYPKVYMLKNALSQII